MTIDEAVTAIGYYAKGDWSTARKKDALSLACDHFIRETGCTRTAVNIATVANTKTVNIISTASDFRAERFINARDTTSFKDVQKRDLLQLQRLYRDEDTGGAPRQIAFEYHTGLAWLWPVPDAIYTIQLLYRAPMVSTGTGTTTVNIPDEWLREVILFGVVPALEMNTPGEGYPPQLWGYFDSVVIPRARDAFGALSGAIDPVDPFGGGIDDDLT